LYAHISVSGIAHHRLQIKGFPQNWGRYQCQLPAVPNFAQLAKLHELDRKVEGPSQRYPCNATEHDEFGMRLNSTQLNALEKYWYPFQDTNHQMESGGLSQCVKVKCRVFERVDHPCVMEFHLTERTHFHFHILVLWRTDEIPLFFGLSTVTSSRDVAYSASCNSCVPVGLITLYYCVSVLPRSGAEF
jgi:hypothetical protein